MVPFILGQVGNSSSILVIKTLSLVPVPNGPFYPWTCWEFFRCPCYKDSLLSLVPVPNGPFYRRTSWEFFRHPVIYTLSLVPVPIGPFYPKTCWKFFRRPCYKYSLSSPSPKWSLLSYSSGVLVINTLSL